MENILRSQSTARTPNAAQARQRYYPLLTAVTRHWREYLMEGIELGLFMISACAFVVLLEYPTSPVRQALTDPFPRRVLVGIAMGLTAVCIIYSPLERFSISSTHCVHPSTGSGRTETLPQRGKPARAELVEA